MRFLLATALLGSLSTVQAAPPGYHISRHHYTSQNQPYRRPPVRLTFGLNTAYYNGDITAASKDNTYQVGVGLGLTHSLSPHLTFGADLSYVRLKAKDRYPGRGLRFEGDNGLLTTFLRYNLFADKSMYIGPKYRETPVQLFLQAGVGTMLYSPKLTVAGPEGNMPLAPEEQSGYPRLAGVLPVGGGLSLRASQALNFTVEGLYYFTTSDLLDDVSQRGNPNSNDGFATVALKMEYAFYKKRGKPLVHFD